MRNFDGVTLRVRVDRWLNDKIGSMRAMLALLCGVFCAAAASDRHVAEWTLFMGGAVGLEGRPGIIRNIAALARGRPRVQVLDWVGMNVDPPDLERVGGLHHLKELHLPGPIWNRNADGNRDGSRDLRFPGECHHDSRS